MRQAGTSRSSRGDDREMRIDRRQSSAFPPARHSEFGATLRLKMACLTLPLTLGMAGCSSVPLSETGTLSSYERLGEAKGKLGKTRAFVDGQGLAKATSVSILPTTYTHHALMKVKQPENRALVANAVDRAMCIALSDKYEVVPAGHPADLTLRTVITDVVPTDETVAGVSKALSLGSGFVLPVSLPRIPAGLGGLAVEAEVLDRQGVQRGAIVWARGANSIMNGARVSEVGDAYALASTFADQYSEMLVTGEEPGELRLKIPSAQRLQSMLGGKPKYAACDAFGRSPGLAEMVGAKFGAPPIWTDKAPQPAAPTQAADATPHGVPALPQ